MSRNNILPYNVPLAKADFVKLNKHNSFLVLLTGLSGSGKSSIAKELAKQLHKLEVRNCILDGDNLRNGLCKDLGFTSNDRNENLRRVAELSKLFVETGVVVIAAFIAPYKTSRASIKQLVGEDNYVEVFVNTRLEICEDRDVKGLYKKARLNEIINFTGISAPYEKPVNPDLEINTEFLSVAQSAQDVLNHIKVKLSILDE